MSFIVEVKHQFLKCYGAIFLDFLSKEMSIFNFISYELTCLKENSII